MNSLKMLTVLFFAAILASACSFNGRGITDSNARIEFEKDDVAISERVSASAKQVLVLGIDWKRLFKKEVGEVRGRNASLSLPVIGSTPSSATEGYATFNLLKENTDYDAILYPQYESTSKGFFPFYLKTDVTVKAKMVKVNP